MTSSLSSKVRLLLESAPLTNVDPQILAEREDSIAAWQLDVGQELGAENIPLAHVVLIVEGTLRVSGRDVMGNPFTLRRIHAGEWWGLWSSLAGVSAATCRTTESTRLLAVPVELWQYWFSNSPELAKWLESHPQREDLYAALRPLFVDSPCQSRTLLDQIDHLQGSLRTVQLEDVTDLEGLKEFDSDISWFLPSVHHQLPDVDPYALEGLSPSLLQRAFQRSQHGLRLVGYPTVVLHELFHPSPPATSLDPAAGSNNAAAPEIGGVTEALPDWQNPDGEQLLAAALSQEQGRPARIKMALKLNRFSATAVLSRVWPCCKWYARPFVFLFAGTLWIACSKEWLAISHFPRLKILVKLPITSG